MVSETDGTLALDEDVHLRSERIARHRALVAIVSIRLYLPVMWGIGGRFLLLAASIMLIDEARHAVSDLQLESEFLSGIARHLADFDKETA